MRVRMQWLWLVPLVAVTAVSLWLTSGGEASAQGARVTIKDTDALSPQQGFDPDQGRWRFEAPVKLVKQGDEVVFQSPANNHFPHTVTNLARTSSPITVPVSFSAGGVFDSGLIQPGQSYTLDTSKLSPGNYPYLCRLHPWMVGEITVQ
jgi:plastocyanin